MAPRFFRFSYFTPSQKDRNLLVHQLRDADAALQVSSVLHDLGYQYGGLLLNPPGDRESKVVIDDSFLHAGDLLLLTTRPPKDDESDRTRSRLQRSYTTLEYRIFECLEQYFYHCSRLEVVLTPSIASKLPKETAKKREIVFRQHGGAFCESYSGRKQYDHPLTTIMYMTFTREAWSGGPGLLALFGMGGPETLIWAHLLRTRFQPLVCHRSFVMAEVTEQVIVPGETTLCFADRWKATILLEIPLDEIKYVAS